MSPKLPASSAGPNEVRAYIAEVLMSKQDATPDVAEEIANLWRLGRGSELRDASVKAFKAIFGDYNGWFLFRIVHEDVVEDWQQSTIGVISYYTLIGSMILAAFLVLRLVVLRAFKVDLSGGFKKVASPIFQALFVMGLSMVNYGIRTPSSSGISIALCGSMIAFPTGVAVLVCLFPQAAGQEGGKYQIAGTE